MTKINNLWISIKNLFQDLKTEISHMQFPNQAVIHSTIFTVLLVGIFFSLYIFTADWIIMHLLSRVFKYGIIKS